MVGWHPLVPPAPRGNAQVPREAGSSGRQAGDDTFNFPKYVSAEGSAKDTGEKSLESVTSVPKLKTGVFR